MEIKSNPTLTEDEIERLFKWREQVVPIEGRAFQWSKPEKHVLVYENGESIGHMGFGRFVISGSRVADVIGIGGVVVRPEHQGRRIPELMFKYVAETEELGSNKLPQTLFCPGRLSSYYGKHGFQEYADGCEFLQNGEYQSTDRFVFMAKGLVQMSGKLKIAFRPW
jgi:predicted N-acetyltransferase YhbS